jgi:predicted DNA-binding transcriptional regulator AlpA
MPASTKHLTADALKVLTFVELCRLIGVSIPTGKRLKKKGDLPKATQLSTKRVGFRVCDIAEWQEKRARAA